LPALALLRSEDGSLRLAVLASATADTLTISNWYAGGKHHLEQFRSSDGKTLLDSQVQGLVDAMAAFAPPAMGQTSLSAAYATQLRPVIAAHWN
jgi:Ca2+-binding RTX toxin-like protein